jgi:hypothetical protein
VSKAIELGAFDVLALAVGARLLCKAGGAFIGGVVRAGRGGLGVGKVGGHVGDVHGVVIVA